MRRAGIELGPAINAAIEAYASRDRVGQRQRMASAVAATIPHLEPQIRARAAAEVAAGWRTHVRDASDMRAAVVDLLEGRAP
jgi:hypothetical protein